MGWFERGARPVPRVFSNLHAMAVEGWGRRHWVLALSVAVVSLLLGLVSLWALLLPVGVAAYLLGLGLWPMWARRESKRLGLEALVVVPAEVGWMRRLCRGVGLELAGTVELVLDLHVDTHVRHASPEAFFAALARDVERIGSLWLGPGASAPGRIAVVANSFNKRLLSLMEERLGPLGAASRRRGCVLQRESADSHSEGFVRAVQERMFGVALGGARDRVDGWDVVVVVGPLPAGERSAPS